MHDKTANETARPPHHVAIVVFDGVALFEVAVAGDVFGTGVTGPDGAPLYRVSVCAPSPSVSTDSGLALQVPNGLDVAMEADTIVVAPPEPPRPAPAAVLQALRAARAAGRRIMSLCTGAFVLAEAGVLDGHSATTHWSACPELARGYPRVRVDPKVLYVDEGDLLTSAGSAASLDLCLHVVQRDHGTEIANRVARDLVVPLHRPGGQAQYIEAPVPAPAAADLFRDTLTWLRQHLDEPVAVGDLAERAAMSPRTFARRFQASTGTTPLQWILAERISLAQRLLETTTLPVDAVARKSGFGTPDNLRKHFARTVRTTPQAYRRAFQAPLTSVIPGSPPARLTRSTPRLAGLPGAAQVARVGRREVLGRHRVTGAERRAEYPLPARPRRRLQLGHVDGPVLRRRAGQVPPGGAEELLHAGRRAHGQHVDRVRGEPVGVRHAPGQESGVARAQLPLLVPGPEGP